MRELGWTESQNTEYQMRCLDDGPFAALAAELVSLHVDVILAVGTNPAVAARDATSRVPVVFASVPDPVTAGLVASLAHPGGNVTGVAFPDLPDPKNVELLTSIVPDLSRIGILFNPSDGPTA